MLLPRSSSNPRQDASFKDTDIYRYIASIPWDVKKNSLSASWVMMDIQSWWPGGNPRLTRDRPISLFSTQARTEIQSPSKNFDWQYSFATTNHLQHQLTTIILCKEQILEICFSFIISTPGSVFWALWGGEVRIEEGLIRLRILWYPPPSHCSSSTIPPESGSLENPPCHPWDPFIQS